MRTEWIARGVVAVAALLSAEAAQAWGLGVSGSGHVQSETRSVGSFDAIELDDSTDIDVRIGEPASVVVETDDNILPLILTDTRGSTLVIHSKGSYRTHHGPQVHIVTPALHKLAIEGSGDARLSGLKEDLLKLSISGSGDITASGEARDLSVSINGSGDARLDALDVRRATVSINGSGDVTLNAAEALDAVVNGSGDIRYHGDPQRVATRVNGSGDIVRR